MSSSSLTNSKQSITSTHNSSVSIFPNFLKEKDLALSSLEPLDNLEEISDEKYDSPMYKQYNTNVYVLSSRNVTGYDLEEAIGTFNQNNIIIDFD